MSENSQLNYKRTEYIYSPEKLKNKHILCVGLGSGGFPVVQHLTMNGIRHWILYDFDKLDEVNLVKHPAKRCDLLKLKIEIAKEWILDRNPQSEVKIYNEKVRFNENGDKKEIHFNESEFIENLKKSDLLIVATDNQESRDYLNQKAIEFHKIAIFGSVFRTGFGGDIFVYNPHRKTGCKDCLNYILMQGDVFSSMDDLLPLTDEEKHFRYGLDLKDFKATGLSSDISLITSLHSKAVLMNLLEENDFSKYFTKSRTNYWVLTIRDPETQFLTMKFEKYFIKPQKKCHCFTN